LSSRSENIGKEAVQILANGSATGRTEPAQENEIGTRVRQDFQAQEDGPWLGSTRAASSALEATRALREGRS
jgi:hypothetical protein